MSQVKVNEDLSILIQDLNSLEKNRLLLMATIYTRIIDDVKSKKISEFEQYFKDMILFYKRDFSKYENDYNRLKNIYIGKMDRFFDQFNIEYVYLQNEVVFAQTNQKIAIANFVASKRGLDKAKLDNNVVLIEKSNKKIFATAQKKLNYDVIIDEGYKRLKKCKEETFEKAEEIFNISNTEIAEIKDGFFDRIKRFFSLMFMGKENFEKNVIKKLEDDLNKMEDLTVVKVSETKIELLNHIAQFEKIRREINLSFNETLNKAS